MAESEEPTRGVSDPNIADSAASSAPAESNSLGTIDQAIVTDRVDTPASDFSPEITKNGAESLGIESEIKLETASNVGGEKDVMESPNQINDNRINQIPQALDDVKDDISDDASSLNDHLVAESRNRDFLENSRDRIDRIDGDYKVDGIHGNDENDRKYGNDGNDGNVRTDKVDRIDGIDTKSEFTDVSIGALEPTQSQQAPEKTADPNANAEPSQEQAEEENNPVLASFMTACQNGDLETVTNLLSSGQVHAMDTFSQGITGLHWAAINNRITVVKFLTENPYSQADPNKLGGSLAASALHWACRNGLVYVVDYLLSHTDADPTLKDSQQYNALHLAVHSSNITLVVYILLKCVVIDKSIYIDEPDNIQCTALHWAAYQGDILSVNALLKYGADVSKVDKSLMTPLHWAFIRGYKSVLATLLDAGSDIFHKNDKSRDSFGVSEDMNCQATWTQVLVEADRNPKRNWAFNTHYISAKTAKLITFFTPYVMLPAALHICSFKEGYAIPKLFASGLLFAVSIFWLMKLIIPVYFRKDKALVQTPYLAGIFSATAFWAVVSWFFVMLPKLWLKEFFTSISLAAMIVAFTYCFFKAMTINPGLVPVPADSNVVFDEIKTLVSIGKFDTEHFCVNTFTRKPLRSKYSKTSGALVARFDHYCPWVYNDIGVRNHKLFITFVYCLSAAIILYSKSALEYFDIYAEQMGYASDVEDSCLLFSDEMCIGYTSKHFIFNLMIWCWIQGIWIMFLCVVQTFQICKGLTTWEFSSLDKKMSSSAYNHSTVPGDFHGGSGNRPNATQPMGHDHRHNNGLGTCMKLLGIDQFTKTIKVGSLSLLKKTTHNDDYMSIEGFDTPTDFGWKQNWLDFWFIGDTEWRNIFFLPIYGENNLNGSVVDYYKLYEYPSKVVGANAV